MIRGFKDRGKNHKSQEKSKKKQKKSEAPEWGASLRIELWFGRTSDLTD